MLNNFNKVRNLSSSTFLRKVLLSTTRMDPAVHWQSCGEVGLPFRTSAISWHSFEHIFKKVNLQRHDSSLDSSASFKTADPHVVLSIVKHYIHCKTTEKTALKKFCAMSDAAETCIPYFEEDPIFALRTFETFFLFPAADVKYSATLI